MPVETNPIVFVSHISAPSHDRRQNYIKPVQSHLVVKPFARWLHSIITKCDIAQSYTSSVPGIIRMYYAQLCMHSDEEPVCNVFNRDQIKICTGMSKRGRGYLTGRCALESLRTICAKHIVILRSVFPFNAQYKSHARTNINR